MTPKPAFRHSWRKDLDPFFPDIQRKGLHHFYTMKKIPTLNFKGIRLFTKCILHLLFDKNTNIVKYIVLPYFDIIKQ